MSHDVPSYAEQQRRSLEQKAAADLAAIRNHLDEESARKAREAYNKAQSEMAGIREKTIGILPQEARNQFLSEEERLKRTYWKYACFLILLPGTHHFYLRKFVRGTVFFLILYIVLANISSPEGALVCGIGILSLAIWWIKDLKRAKYCVTEYNNNVVGTLIEKIHAQCEAKLKVLEEQQKMQSGQPVVPA